MFLIHVTHQKISYFCTFKNHLFINIKIKNIMKKFISLAFASPLLMASFAACEDDHDDHDGHDHSSLVVKNDSNIA